MVRELRTRSPRIARGAASGLLRPVRHRARAVGAFDWLRIARASAGVLLIVAAGSVAACGDTPTSTPERHAERQPAGANAGQPAEAPNQQSERAARARQHENAKPSERTRPSDEVDAGSSGGAADRSGRDHAGGPSAPAGASRDAEPATARQRVRANARELLANPGGNQASKAAKELGAGRLLDESTDQPPASLQDLCQSESDCP